VLATFISFARPLGFFGQAGPLWFLLGIICTAVMIAILFKILRLVLPALGVTPPWDQVIIWTCVLVVFVCFVNYAFGGWF
jgi:hypothetical protein